MISIDERFVPFFYLTFALVLLGLMFWAVRRTFSLRTRLSKAFSMKVPNEQPGPVLEWSATLFKDIKLSSYALTHTSLFFIQKTTIQLALEKNSNTWLHFNAYFEHRIFRQPQGAIRLKTSKHDIVLQFYYKNGEESAEILINQEKLGSLSLDVKALPLPLADVLLFDRQQQPIGKWTCQLKPSEEIKLGEIRYGEVILQGREIAKMLAYNPKRIGKGTMQYIFDIINLPIYPDSPNFHYHRGAPYFQEVGDHLTIEQEQWLLALTALLLYKDAWYPQGKRKPSPITQ